MHIPDGMLDTRTVATTWAAAIPALGVAVRKVRARIDDGRLVLMAVLAALIFALQMLNFPVAGGTSGHFAGGALAAILLGPWAAMLVISTVVIVQALVFGDGGVLALGANIVNMAVLAPLVGWWIYSLALRLRDTRSSRVAGAFVGAWAATMVSAVSAGVMLWFSGAAQLGPVVGAMAIWHALIGIGEGFVTSGMVAYVLSVRPDLLRTDTEAIRSRTLVISAGALALAAAALSLWASRLPDGLESVAGSLGFAGREVPAAGLLPSYVIPGVSNTALAGVLAALVGVALTFAAASGLLAAMRLRRRPAATDAVVAAHDGHLGVHSHVHTHDGEVHEHVHHHTTEPHEHGHPEGAARIASGVSVLHRLDPRAKIIAGLLLVLAVVLTAPMRPLEFALVTVLLFGAAAVARVPAKWVLTRAALVLPVAGGIALFAPVAASGGSFFSTDVLTAFRGSGWVIAWSIVSKAWLSTLVTVIVSGTTPTPQLIRGLEALRVPDVMIALFSFVYRYVDVFRSQVRSMRTALDSRAPSMRRAGRWRLYGNLAGSLFIRAYDRGERIHQAMLSRGFTGALPSAEALEMRAADLLLIVVVALAAAAIVLY